MIVLDTNVIAEAMKPSANPAVIAWLNEQVLDTVYLSARPWLSCCTGLAACLADAAGMRWLQAWMDCLSCLDDASCHSMRKQLASMPRSPSRRGRRVRDFLCRMAISQRRPRCMALRWRHVIPDRSKLPDCRSLIPGAKAEGSILNSSCLAPIAIRFPLLPRAASMKPSLVIFIGDS